MRTSRIAAVAAALTMTTTLAACGGGPEALDEKAAKEAILTEEELPLDGFTRQDVQTGLEPTEDFDPASLPDTDKGCKKALEEFASVKYEDYLTGQATGVFTKQDKNVSVQVGGAKKEPAHLAELTKKVGEECDEITQDAGGTEMTISFEEFTTGEVEGMVMTSELGGQKNEIRMGGQAVGENLVYVVGNISEDELGEVVAKQAEKVEDAG